MKLTRFALALGFASAVAVALAGVVQAAGHEDHIMTIHNNTGHDVYVFLFLDDKVHTNETGGKAPVDEHGVQHGMIKNSESAEAAVPTCKFAVPLVDHEDIWHAEFHDCSSTDLEFTSDTGHGKKK